VLRSRNVQQLRHRRFPYGQRVDADPGLAFSTLDELATAIRAEVNAGIFARIVQRMGPEVRQRLQGATVGVLGMG